MIKELQMALNGMDNLSINGNDYGAFFDWDKTPDTKVDYWIKHFESIIERCDAVMLWRDAAYSNGSTPESLGDVYEQKMDNLRKFIKSEGWSDEVFRDAYVVKYHLWARFFWPIEIICGIIPLLLMSILSFSVWAWACKRPSGYY
jgi:hypothetical protein